MTSARRSEWLTPFMTCSVPLYGALLWLSFTGVAPFAAPYDAAQGIYDHEYNYPLLWTYVTLVCALFVVYFWSLWAFRRHPLPIRTVLGVGVTVGVLSWCAYPGIFSNDVLAYVGYGRIMAVHHLNPWSTGYDQIQDFYSAYAWYPNAMPYGPVVAPFLAVAGWISNASVPLAFYFVKFCWLFVHLASGYLVFRIAQRLQQMTTAGDRSVDPCQAAWAYLCNPLLLVELVNNGHCDGLLVFFGLLSLHALVRGRDHAALLYGLLGMLVKPTLLLWVAVAAFYLLRQGRWRPLLTFVAVGLAAAFVLSHTLFATAASRTALTNPHDLTNAYSIHSVIIHASNSDYLHPYESEEYAPLRNIIAALFAIFCLWRLSRVHVLADVIHEYLLTSIGLMIFYSARIWPWYLAWLIPFAVLGRDGSLRRFVLLLSMTVLADYAVPFRLVKESLPWHVVRICISLGLPLAAWMADGLYFWARGRYIESR